MVSRKEPPTTGTSSVSAIIPSFCSTSSGIAKERRYGQATSTVPMIGRNSLSRVVERYLTAAVRLLFRADAAFAKPELYEYLETRQIGYS